MLSCKCFKSKFINFQDCIKLDPLIGLVGRVFANGPGDRVQSQVRSYQTLKMVFNTNLINTQHYKVRIKGKIEQSRGRSSTLPYTSV